MKRTCAGADGGARTMTCAGPVGLSDWAHAAVDRIGDARGVAERALVEIKQDRAVLG